MQLFNTGNSIFIAFITSSIIFVSSCKKKSSSTNRSCESSTTEETADKGASDQTTGKLSDGVSSVPLKKSEATSPGKPNQSTVNHLPDIIISGPSENMCKYKLGESGSTNISSFNGYSAEHNTSHHTTNYTTSFNDGSMRLCVATLGRNSVCQEYTNATESTWKQGLLLPAVLSVTSSSPNGSYKFTEFISIAITFNQSVKVQGNPIFNLANGGCDNYSAMII